MYFGTGVVLNSNEIEYMNIYARGWKGVENDFIFWKKGKILDLFVWIRFVFSFSKAFYEYLNSFTLFLAVRIGISCIEVNEWKKKKPFESCQNLHLNFPYRNLYINLRMDLIP